MSIAIGFVLLLVLLAVGLPVALTLLTAAAAGIYTLMGPDMLTGLLTTTPLASIQLYAFIAIPMFILMANFIVASGISDELFAVAQTWAGRTPGGLAHATALTGAAFGAISGSSTAAAATLSSTSIPGMIKQGYDPKLAAGVAAISGTLAMLIPPSVAMILYAIIADLSVAKLLFAGLIPGILIALTIMGTVLFLVWRNPKLAPSATSYTLMQKIVALKTAWAFVLLFVLVAGSIYFGLATPTETSALGALAALLLCFKRKVPLKKLREAFLSAAEASCMIALIMIGAHLFGYFVTLSQVAQDLVNLVASLELNRWVILFLVVLLYLILGFFMDLVSMLIVTVPIVIPLVMSLDFNPYWFAVITVIAGEIGMVTPPLGLNVYVISKYTKIPVMQGFRGAVPFVVAILLTIFVLALFPALVTWLPGTMS